MKDLKRLINNIFSKKIELYVIIVIGIISLISIAVLSLGFDNNIFDLSSLKNKWLNTPTEILYQGDNIILYKPVTYDLFDEITRENYIQTNLGNLALCFYANEIGIEASEREITDKIKEQREISNSNEELRNANAKMFEDMGVTEEEYWDSDKYRKLTEISITIDKLLKYQEEIIIEENRNNSEANIAELLDNWKLDTIDKTLLKDNVKKIN